jgi:hypothetical protein
MDLIAAKMTMQIAHTYQQGYPPFVGVSSLILPEGASMGA